MGKKFDFPHETLRAYLENKADVRLRDELVERAIPLVECTASLIVIRKRVWLPQHIDEDELISEGLAQLTPIVEEFNPPACDNLSNAFYVHVRTRTQWRLLDYIRDERLQSRTTIDHALKFKAAFGILEKEKGYAPTIGEVAQQLGVSSAIAEEWRILAMEIDVRNTSIDENFACSRERNKPASLHEVLAGDGTGAQDADAGFFALLPSSLTAIERAIIISVYRDNRTMLEIGNAFGFSESRVSQMFSSILPRIRTAYFKQLRKADGECYGN